MLEESQLSQVRQEFAALGLSIADWAREHNFSLPLVYAVLKGRNQATRGESHKIAVALRLKNEAPQLRFIGPGPSAQANMALAANDQT
jgi:gp16 family phage-associated protein